MKSEQFNFSSKTASIRGKKEKEPAKSKRNWDRIIYLVLLVVILVGLLYFLFTSYFLVRGKGRVMAQQLTIRAPFDMQMVDFYTQIGTQLQKGDSLFMYTPLSRQTQADSLQQFREQQVEQANDLYDIRADIAEKRQEQRALQRKLDHYQARRQRLEKEIQLGVETAQSLRRIDDEVVDIQSDMEAVDQQLQLAYQRRNRLQRGGQAGSLALNEVSESPQVFQQLYRSPVSGEVSNIFRGTFEHAFKTEEIISIQRDSTAVIVKVVFNRDDASRLPVGDEISLQFDNGQKSRGTIIDLYAAEAELLPLLNAVGIEADDKVVVEMKPVDEETRQQWRMLNGMGLTASKSLF